MRLGCPRRSRAGPELKGLGAVVPVLLPGTACLRAPARSGEVGRQELRGRDGAECAAVEPRAGPSDRSCCCWEAGCWLLCEMRLPCVGLYVYVLSSAWEGSRSHMLPLGVRINVSLACGRVCRVLVCVRPWWVVF